MARCWWARGLGVAMAIAISAAGQPVSAQQPKGGWQAETTPPTAPGAPPAATPLSPSMTLELPNTTVVPRSTPEAKSSAPTGSGSQLSLVALLTDDGQNIDQGLVWRVYREKPGPDGKPVLVSTHREPSPSLRLAPGTYMVNVAFGRANLTRKIVVGGDRAAPERFVLNAGGLRLVAVLANGEAVTDRAVSYDIYSDERDQYGQRTKLMSGVKPGTIIRLNAGIYNIVSSYGDANAVARSDVTVEAGKLTEATLSHAAAKVTFKLVARPNGDAIADTQWVLADSRGQTVKESVGALPSHILAPGSYTVSARNGGEVFQRQFSVQAGDVAQVEVVRR
jgi:preprotein translocase subunit YajC